VTEFDERRTTAYVIAIERTTTTYSVSNISPKGLDSGATTFNELQAGVCH